MSGEFKPCPFCGSMNLVLGYEGQPVRRFFVICNDCKAQGPSWDYIQGVDCPAFSMWAGRKRESELEKGYDRRIARLNEFADLDQCDGTCDEVPPFKQCSECLACHVLNLIGFELSAGVKELEEE